MGLPEALVGAFLLSFGGGEPLSLDVTPDARFTLAARNGPVHRGALAVSGPAAGPWQVRFTPKAGDDGQPTYTARPQPDGTLRLDGGALAFELRWTRR